MNENQSYVDEAKTIIDGLKKSGKFISISQIRNILAMTADIYNQVKRSPEGLLTENIQEQLQYLKVRIIYDAGKDKSGSVRAFVEKSGISKKLDALKTKKDYIKFSNYMEALVAWRQHYGDND